MIFYAWGGHKFVSVFCLGGGMGMGGQRLVRGLAHQACHLVRGGRLHDVQPIDFSAGLWVVEGRGFLAPRQPRELLLRYGQHAH